MDKAKKILAAKAKMLKLQTKEEELYAKLLQDVGLTKDDDGYLFDFIYNDFGTLTTVLEKHGLNS